MTEEIKDESLADYITRLQQENEHLNKDLLTERQENAELATENVTLTWKNDCLKHRESIYRKALEEIKIIADDTFQVCDDDCGCDYLRIKRRIDEVEKPVTKNIILKMFNPYIVLLDSKKKGTLLYFTKGDSPHQIGLTR